MKELVKDIVRAVAVPIATELAGAFRDARHKEHEAAIAARKAVAEWRGQSEPAR